MSSGAMRLALHNFMRPAGNADGHAPAKPRSWKPLISGDRRAFRGLGSAFAIAHRLGNPKVMQLC